MCPANGPDIGIFAAGKPFEALVDNYIMYKEIGKSVSHYAKADGLLPPYLVERPKHDQQHAGDRENDKKSIIFFKKSRFHLVMIPV
jgi:hypothetical protein